MPHPIQLRCASLGIPLLSWGNGWIRMCHSRDKCKANQRCVTLLWICFDRTQTQRWAVNVCRKISELGKGCCIVTNCVTSVHPASLQVVPREPQSLGGRVSSHFVQREFVPGSEQPDLQERLLAFTQVGSCFSEDCWD